MRATGDLGGTALLLGGRALDVHVLERDVEVVGHLHGEGRQEALADVLPGTVGLAWANDSKTLFYVGKDETTLRTRYVKRHLLGTPDELREAGEDQIARRSSRAPASSRAGDDPTSPTCRHASVTRPSMSVPSR